MLAEETSYVPETKVLALSPPDIPTCASSPTGQEPTTSTAEVATEEASVYTLELEARARAGVLVWAGRGLGSSTYSSTITPQLHNLYPTPTQIPPSAYAGDPIGGWRGSIRDTAGASASDTPTKPQFSHIRFFHHAGFSPFGVDAAPKPLGLGKNADAVHFAVLRVHAPLLGEDCQVLSRAEARRDLPLLCALACGTLQAPCAAVRRAFPAVWNAMRGCGCADALLSHMLLGCTWSLDLFCSRAHAAPPLQ